MKRSLFAIALATVVLLAGCQSWTRGGDYTSRRGYRISTPSTWIYHPTLGGDFVATHDGLFLQRLSVRRAPLATPLDHSKRTLTKDLTPLELAEAIIDDLKADQSNQRLVIVENSPATLDGRAAARVMFDYYLEDDTHLKCVRYICVHADNLYTVQLTAPARHYFDDALPVFEKAARSFAFTQAD